MKYGYSDLFLYLKQASLLSYSETAKEDKTGRCGIGLTFGASNNTAGSSVPPTSGHKFFCDICQVACPSQVSFNDHLAGAKHKKKIANTSGDVPPPGKDLLFIESLNRFVSS